MIEAMKQWLEALEDFVDVIKYDNEQDDIGRRACCDVLSYNPHSESCKAIKSIASLRQAIAELESQKPVAWRLESGKAVWLWFERTDPEANSALPNDVTAIPLYAHPPQRSESSGKPSAWVGLTNEELTDLFYNTNLGQQSAVSQAIALLKEKNS